MPVHGGRPLRAAGTEPAQWAWRYGPSGPPLAHAPRRAKAPAAPPGPTATRSSPARRWPGYALVACGVALLPWLVVLAAGLPPTHEAPHWAAAWVGLDAMEATGLIATGLLTLRRHPARSAAAGATATLLVVDAWFDVMTSPGPDFGTALAMAFAAELPLAAVCAVIAVRGFPRIPAPAPATGPAPVPGPAPSGGRGGPRHSDGRGSRNRSVSGGRGESREAGGPGNRPDRGGRTTGTPAGRNRLDRPGHPDHRADRPERGRVLPRQQPSRRPPR